jgi:succinyl-diaminopimelate desuccinylase
LNLRYPVTCTFEDMMNPFNQTISGTGFRVEKMIDQKPLYYPRNSSLVNTLLKVYSEMTGDKGKPLAIGGGTYAKEMPNTVAFGPIFPGRPMVEHQPNEYILLQDLVFNANIYARAIYELAK